MTTIKASCPRCGDCVMPPAAFLLVVCSRSEWSYYGFTCPGCTEWVSKPACDEIAALLRSGGVPEEYWHVPAEVFEPKSGPAVNADDVLDFVLSLDRLDDAVRSL